MNLSNNPFIFLFTRTWKYSEGNRPRLVLSIIMGVFAKAQTFINPLVIAWLLNTIQREGVTINNIYKLLGIASILTVLIFTFWVLHGPSRILERKNAFLMRKNYKQYMINGVLSLPLAWHANHHSGNTINKIEKGSEGLFEFADNLFEPIHTIVQFIVAYCALLFFNIHAGYIVLIIVALAFYTIIKMDRKLKAQYDALFATDNEIAAKVYDSISNITTVIILGLQNLISKDIVRKMIKPFLLFSKNAKLNEIKWFLISVYSSIMVVLVFGSYLVSSIATGKVVLVGTLYALYAYANEINDIFFGLANLMGVLVRQKAQVENAEKLSEDFIEESHIEQHALDKWKELDIRNLSFSYSGRKEGKLNLRDISLQIKCGEKIALIGESGSGKTTFMKLLKGLYEPNQAEVFIDGRELKNKFKTLKKNTTLIPQEPELFATTIRKNITMGLPYAQEELDKYVKLACFDKVIRRLLKGYESIIGERGVNLSGGEKQRLALARGLLAAQDTPIILMDEPTSSVDSLNEIRIFNNIFTRFRNRTILAAIHRLNLLKSFDRIFFFDKGKLIAIGTFDELLKTSKKFEAMWKEYSHKHRTAINRSFKS